MEQMKYRIKVEPIEGVELEENEELLAEWTDGIECNGFCLLLNQGRTKAQCNIHNITTTELAAAMKGESSLQAAAKIAELLDEEAKKQFPDFLKSLAKKLEKE